MTRKIALTGMLVLILALGMTVAGCGDDSEDGTAFDGTWIMTEDGENLMKIVAANGALKVYNYEYEGPAGGAQTSTLIEQIRGTYTASGNTVNVTITQINTGYMSWDGSGSRPADSWTNYAALPDEIKSEIPQTMQGTISGKQLSINGGDFTKQ